VTLYLLGWWGCAKSITPLYEAAREAALAQAGPAGASWEPDVVLQLSAPVVEDVLRTAVRQQGPLQKTLEISGARVQAQVRLKSLAVARAKPCPGGCVGLEADFAGELDWAVGPLQGTTPFSAHGLLDAVFEVVQQKGELEVQGAPRRLRELELEVGELEGRISGLRRSVRAWLEDEALARVPAQPFARFPSDGLPVRAARVLPDGEGLRIDLLTDVPEPGRASAGPRPQEGFTLTVSEPTLLSLARQEAFEHGPVGYEVVPEPTSLDFTEEGFVLGLRLWRPVGRGWWRDYTITGSARVAGGKLSLAPREVTEGPKSPGAALVDPLAALAEGLILDAIEDAVQTSLPLHGQEKIGEAAVRVELQQLAPAAEAVRGTGTVQLGKRD
jgi:hypothetical protein